MTTMHAPTIAPTTPAQGFALSVTKVATIADFAAYGKVGKAHRYYVRNFTLVAKVAA
jgi:hypothetical protein